MNGIFSFVLLFSLLAIAYGRTQDIDDDDLIVTIRNTGCSIDPNIKNKNAKNVYYKCSSKKVAWEWAERNSEVGCKYQITDCYHIVIGINLNCSQAPRCVTTPKRTKLVIMPTTIQEGKKVVDVMLVDRIYIFIGVGKNVELWI